MISYALHENHLTPAPNDYRAQVQFAGTVEMEDVIARMIERGSTTTEADVLAVLQDYHAAIESLVLEGFKVLTPGANYGVSMKGVFDGREDNFDRSRHQVEANVSPGAQFRRTIRDRARVQRAEATKPSPSPLTYVDLNTAETNSLVTPGGMGRLSGYRLKFDADDPTQGLFFVAADHSETHVAVVGQNLPAELMFLVPTGLTSGEYTLAVRVLYGEDDLRTGTLDAPLTVA